MGYSPWGGKKLDRLSDRGQHSTCMDVTFSLSIHLLMDIKVDSMS